MKTRSTRLERQELETPSPEELERIVGYLAFVNKWLGGTRAFAYHLKGFRDRITVLDVAGGGGDIARSLALRFPNLRMVTLDKSETMLSFGKGLTRVRGDGRCLPFGDRSVDFILANLFFHHLTENEILSTLREFDRVARRGIIVNDLLRNRRALTWIRLLTLFANPFVRVDGPLSVWRGFTVPEIRALAARSGLDWLKVRVHFGHRFTLYGERPPS